ncbi:MAG: enoyl-CoA hydratase [Proteobacteria bacterium]|nr:MAG: enoyl-CoA hydratase [Pseudomonadota bacterium]
MSDTIVTYEQRDEIALVTMDDGKANALSHAMLEQLRAAMARARAEAKAVILAGRPGRFSGGFDLRVMGAGPQAVIDLVGAGGELFLELYAHPQPLVMAVTGHALAGGVLLAATGDTRIGIEGPFKLGLNEVTNGMAVPILAHDLARERLDPRHLVASVLQAKIYDPAGAVTAGWLDRVVAPEALAEAAMTEAKALAALPRRAYAATKLSLRSQAIAYMRQTMADNLAAIAGT